MIGLLRPQSELSLYSAAVDLLADLADIPAPATLGNGHRVSLHPYGQSEHQRDFIQVVNMDPYLLLAYPAS